MDLFSKFSSYWCLPIWLEHIFNEGLLDGLHFREFLAQFWSIELVVASWCDNDLCLLLECEVIPFEAWVNVVAVHFQDLVMANNSRICEVPYACEVSLCHLDGNREKFIQDCHRVRDVYYLLVSSDLGDEVSGVGQVWGDGHSDS